MEKRENFYNNELNIERVNSAIEYLAENLNLNEIMKVVREISYDMVCYYVKENCGIIYKEYTGVDQHQLIDNLFRIRDHVDKSKLHIRVPRIQGINTEKNIEESVKWIKDVLKVEAEVFDYYIPAKINESIWDDDDDEVEDDE